LDEQQVDHDHSRQEEEVQGWQRCETKESGKWRVREHAANRDNQERRQRERPAGVAAQRITCRTNNKQDQCPGRERLHEPTGMEEHSTSVEDPQHNEEGQEVEDRADRPDEDHKITNQFDIPVLRLFDVAGIHVIGWNGHLREIVEEVVEQNLRRQHGEEGQEDIRPRHTEHIAEV